MAAVPVVEPPLPLPTSTPLPTPTLVPQEGGLTCEGRPHGEVMLVNAQQVAGLHLPCLGSIQQLLRQRTGQKEENFIIFIIFIIIHCVFFHTTICFCSVPVNLFPCLPSPAHWEESLSFLQNRRRNSANRIFGML